MRETELTVWTVGHSTHTYEQFLELLRAARITAIADVRSAPFSRHVPQFSKDFLQNKLRTGGIAYSFLGRELGGRPRNGPYYRDGVADYERMAQSPEFARGLQRALEGARKFRMALLCAERDPMDCHRCLLVGRALATRGATVKHILADGRIADHREIEERLLKSEGLNGDDLFLSCGERLAEAYRKRARKVANAEQPHGSTNQSAAE